MRFPEGSDPRFARAGEKETLLVRSGLASTTVLRFCKLITFLVPFASKSVQKTFKIGAKSKHCKRLGVFCFRTSGTLWLSKNQCFLKPEALTSQKISRLVRKPLALELCRISQIGDAWPFGKDNLACLPLRSGSKTILDHFH